MVAEGVAAPQADCVLASEPWLLRIFDVKERLEVMVLPVTLLQDCYFVQTSDSFPGSAREWVCEGVGRGDPFRGLIHDFRA